MSTTTSGNESPSRLKPGELKELAETTASPCVSILMPTHRSGPQTQQGAIRFKNQFAKAKQLLEEGGHDCSILDPIESLSTNLEFWQHCGEGLAIYLTADHCRLVQLPSSVDEHVCVGDSFFLLPLVGQQDADQSFFVLSLTWDEAKLYRSRDGKLELVETESLPAKFHDLVLPRDPEESLQNTSHRNSINNAGPSTAMFHGHGEGEDKINADRDQYLSLVGEQVSGAMYNLGIPLVIAATTEVAGHFESTTDCTADAKVEGSPSQWTDKELHDRVQDVVAKQLTKDNADQVERFGTAVAQSKGSCDISEITEAAETGRVDTVMLSSEIATSDRVSADQANAVLCQTLQHGGEVFCCPADQVPFDSGIAAVFRY
ncbi:baeRF3 domain-containing protein [Stieleria varia]|uniref:Uncharacterized protein n=1 Tax=Stieleria varia TaxID=2528005 RepID=A0A5C6B0C6_9BACT|nr:hypothetical protein [Stieleria varia]TWU04909.1 hypothetical protein Pla52n_29540 [Stieleria varia]